jgi:hypothetical protein
MPTADEEPEFRRGIEHMPAFWKDYRLVLKTRAVAALTAALTVCFSAAFLLAPQPAEARCSAGTIAAIAARINDANDAVAEYPGLAQAEISSAYDDLHACFGTARGVSERWQLFILREQAQIEFAAALASEGRLTAARDELKRTRSELGHAAQGMRSDPRKSRTISELQHEAAIADDVAHNRQRLASMKVAGNRVFSWPMPSQRRAVSKPRASPESTAPTASATLCARPNVAATTLHAVEPDTPPMAQQQGITGTVQVVVSLDATSHVTGTRIQSSPSALLNWAALSAARQSTFLTEIRDCKPIAADLIFTVDFASR